MQTTDKKDLESRGLVYLSKLISPQLSQGENYKDLKKIIIIWILDFNYFETNTYHNIAHMRFDKIKKEKYIEMGSKTENGLVTDKAEMHFIELPKFIKKNPSVENS